MFTFVKYSTLFLFIFVFLFHLYELHVKKMWPRGTLIHPASARNCQRSNFRKRPSRRYQRPGKVFCRNCFKNYFIFPRKCFISPLKKNYGKINTMFLLSIHNHIIFCAADNIEHRKYHDCKQSVADPFACR